ncbi:MAG: ChaB family protein [Methanotrichaceae archaeon]|nr:ChaB family protein [Methanotrichaceae archaeon]
MQYNNISELPKSVRNLPRPAKNLYLKAFNGNWEELADEISDEQSREKSAHDAAWAAVKREYTKDEDSGEWVKIGEYDGKHSRHALRYRRSRSGGSASQERAHA